MTVNATKIDNALANLPELKKMFSNASLTDPTLDGFAKRFKTVTAALLASDGSLTTRTSGLGDQLTRNQKDQDTLTIRLAATEKRIRAQYTALDTTMAQLTSTSTFVTNQIAAWNKSSG
jgi:flagellar hook-associated protein 2